MSGVISVAYVVSGITLVVLTGLSLNRSRIKIRNIKLKRKERR